VHQDASPEPWHRGAPPTRFTLTQPRRTARWLLCSPPSEEPARIRHLRDEPQVARALRQAAVVTPAPAEFRLRPERRSERATCLCLGQLAKMDEARHPSSDPARREVDTAPRDGGPLALGEIEAALRRIRLCVEVAEDLAELLTVALAAVGGEANHEVRSAGNEPTERRRRDPACLRRLTPLGSRTRVSRCDSRAGRKKRARGVRGRGAGERRPGRR